jgi:hypothetical protein
MGPVYAQWYYMSLVFERTHGLYARPMEHPVN